MSNDNDTALQAVREDEERAIRSSTRGASAYVPSIANPPTFPAPNPRPYPDMDRAASDDIREAFRATFEESDRRRLMGTSVMHLEREIAYIESRKVEVPRVFRECLERLTLIEAVKSYDKPSLDIPARAAG